MKSSSEMLSLQPMELMELLTQETTFNNLNLDEVSNFEASAIEALNQATAFVCYFKQMETAAKIQKRKAKREKADPEEVDRCMGVEEVFETFKRISEQKYDTIAKIFTAKRLKLDELKMLGKMP